MLLLTLSLACSCGSDNIENDKTVQSGNSASNEESAPLAKLEWWNENERYAAFLKYDGHGVEKQDAPVKMSDSTAEGYVLYSVPKEDYISYWHKLEESGLELYDYNFGLFDQSEIIKSAENGYAMFVKDKYMLELNYSEYSNELIFHVYISEDRGE